ncbi:MAG TPA: TlpA disulfide reductase family protein [Nitrospiraceae bacterium]|jgi:thiol-disulfide isomerase/thioredoxin|nr:TlpA disulfide reductase family protein [Nitrospiraceae bacterium]
MRGIRSGLCILTILWFGLGGGLTGNGEGIAEAAPSAIPPFELVTLAGEVYSHETITGRPTLLVFWAPWCKVCQRELPSLSDFYQRKKPARLRVVSIGFADTRSHVEAFVKASPGTFVFPTAYDEDRWTARAFNVNATPTSVLVDAQGHIVLVHRGAGILQNAKFQEFLSALTE